MTVTITLDDDDKITYKPASAKLEDDTLLLLQRDLQSNLQVKSHPSGVTSLSITTTTMKLPPPSYLSKFCGIPNSIRPPSAPRYHILFSFIGSFVGILILSLFHYLVLDESDLVSIVGSFGAHAVLVFAAPNASLAQPWNAIFGNVISSFIGVTCFKLLGVGIPSENVTTLLGTSGYNFLSAPLAVSLSIVAMYFTSSLHPPGGAMALIATIGSAGVKRTGYWYVLMPGLFASLVQVFVAIVINNCSKDDARRYPRRWKPAFCCSTRQSKGA